VGFEPTVRLSPYTRFPGVRLKPLIHLSAAGKIITEGRGETRVMVIAAARVLPEDWKRITA
jgi:hypothetical protein